MKGKYLFLLLLLAGSQRAAAAEYPVSALADSLQREAAMVKRYDETVIEIKSPGKARYYHKYANTILGSAGEPYAAFYCHYNRFWDLSNASGTLYDASGKELKRVKKKEMDDYSGTDESSLMTDTRYKKHDFYYRSYPFTVAYEEESEADGLFGLPEWMPQQRADIAVEYSKLVIITPKDYVLRYKPVHYNGNPVVTENGDKKVYTWEIKNLPAARQEAYAPSWKKRTPQVLLALSDFEIQGYKGNMTSWEGFGLFIGSLLQNRDVLPDEVKRQVHALTDGLPDEYAKIDTLYSFLQKNTRYISIQLGIGGWQPYDAAFVVSKRYGDCKALSNYMVALLKEAGIKAYYVLIRAGDGSEGLVADFPSNQFNHATVVVPVGKDSVWLECTSQTVPAGYIGSFTGGREALLIDEKGGHVVHTTSYDMEKNQAVRQVQATVDDNGKLSASVQTRYTGVQQEDVHDIMYQLTRKEQAEHLKKRLNLPTYDITDFSYTEKRNRLPVVDERLQLSAENYATVSGRRLFITPNIFSTYISKLKEEENRVNDIVFSHPYKDVDSVQISLPAGYTAEAMPRNVELNSRFGQYSIRFTLQDNRLSMVRVYAHYSGSFPAATYKELVAFNNAVYKADNSRLVLVKKE